MKNVIKVTRRRRRNDIGVHEQRLRNPETYRQRMRQWRRARAARITGLLLGGVLAIAWWLIAWHFTATR
jgi:hypothetical protein